MTLDEAIKHAEEVANEKERLGAMGRGNPDKYAPSTEQCFKCAEEHRQLAEWLKELKRLREQKRPHGEWIYNKGDIEVGVPPTNECSECGHYIDELLHPNFCPNCGADMRVKNELNRVNKELNSEIEKSKSEIVPDFRDGWRLKEGDHAAGQNCNQEGVEGRAQGKRRGARRESEPAGEIIKEGTRWKTKHWGKASPKSSATSKQS